MAEPSIHKFIKSDGSALVVVINNLPAFKALKVSRQVIALAGPIVPKVVALSQKAGGKTAALADLDIGGVIDALAAIDDDQLAEVTRALAVGCQVQGLKGTLLENFDLVFTGELECMARWFMAALDHNFGPTLRGLLNGKQAA